jgi:hypothetical protein
MYAAVWTSMVYTVTTAAAGMHILSGYDHCGTDVLTLSYGLEA